jgi:hypothetical protein
MTSDAPTTRATGRPVTAMAIAVIGAIVLAVGFIVEPARTAAAYLTAYTTAIGVVLGALAMVMIAQLTRATWFVVLRREAEQIIATLPALAALFIPVLLSMHVLYPWTHPETLPPAARALVDAKAGYLNVPFFFVRAIIYFVVWIGLAELIRRRSLAQDRDEQPGPRPLYGVSAWGLPLYALTISFAAFDWLMSLTPTWYSTIYGVYFFAGGMVGAMGFLIVLTEHARRRGELTDVVATDHLHALAKVTLTFVLFWTYIGFSQLIVIWSGNIPAEVVWYRARVAGGWAALAGVLVFGQFALPFCALVVRSFKRSFVLMMILGVWLTVVHYLDVYWVTIPAGANGHVAQVWTDAGALLFVGGVTAATWALRRRGERTAPVGDPRFHASLEYRAD